MGNEEIGGRCTRRRRVCQANIIESRINVSKRTVVKLSAFASSTEESLVRKYATEKTGLCYPRH